MKRVIVGWSRCVMNVSCSSINIHRRSRRSPFSSTGEEERRIPPNDLMGYIQISLNLKSSMNVYFLLLIFDQAVVKVSNHKSAINNHKSLQTHCLPLILR